MASDTKYDVNLNMDSRSVKTPAEYNETNDQWEMPVKQADGQDATQGAKADAAVTDPTAEGTAIALLKGLIKQLQGDGTGALPTEVTGSTVDLRGASADKPLANAVEVGTTYWSVDTDPHAKSIEVSNGTTWVVI